MEVDPMTRRALLYLFLFYPSTTFLAFGQDQAQATGAQPGSPAMGYAIMFERLGGYAGWYDRFWIYPDGRIENEAGKVKEIAPAVVTSFRQRIEPLLPSTTTLAAPMTESALKTEKGQKAGMPQKAEDLCSDCYRYRVTILIDSGIRSTVLSEPLKTKTDKLAQVIQELRDLLFASRF
jgi:hypothetical protein